MAVQLGRRPVSTSGHAIAVRCGQVEVVFVPGFESVDLGSHLARERDDHLQAVRTAKTPSDLVPVLASLPDTNTGRTLFLAGKSRRLPTRRVAGTPSPEGRVRVREGRHGLCPGQIFENPVVDIELQLRFGRARITCPTLPLSTSTTE